MSNFGSILILDGLRSDPILKSMIYIRVIKRDSISSVMVETKSGRVAS